jgi:hypothetical protein
MDAPTRQSYIVAAVEEDERTAAVGITNIQEMLLNLSLHHWLVIYCNPCLFCLHPIIAGMLKIAYDLALYFNSKNKKSQGEKQ